MKLYEFKLFVEDLEIED
jgi:Ca2+-binding EF-hand superfamily protein